MSLIGFVDQSIVRICICAAFLIEAMYVTSSADTNACPQSTVGITTVATCQAAANALGYTYVSSGSWSGIPGGCALALQSQAVFHTTVAGSSHSEYKRICVQARHRLFLAPISSNDSRQEILLLLSCGLLLLTTL